MRSDDEETAQTVAYMCELASADADNPLVTGAASEALNEAGIDSDASDLDKTNAVYWWLKRTIRYVPTPGTSPLVDQTLIAPTALLAMPEPIGDCPQFSMLGAAMLEHLGIKSRYVTIAAEPALPDQWSHIYLTVEVGPGQFLPFDASNGPAPGAEYARPFKRRIWPFAAAEKGTDQAAMLRAVYRHGRTTGARNSSLRRTLGDVQCDADGNCTDTGTTYTPGQLDQLATQGDCAWGTNADGSCMPFPTGRTPSFTPTPTASPAQSPNFLNTLLTDATGLASGFLRAQQKPYYVTSPGGQSVLYNPATGTFGQPVSSSIGNISPVFLIGLGLFALLAVGGKK